MSPVARNLAGARWPLEPISIPRTAEAARIMEHLKTIKPPPTTRRCPTCGKARLP